MKKVCIVTGSRAEYGLLKLLIKEIDKSPKIQLKLIVTGSHLSKKFGLTINEIKNDGVVIDYKVKIDLSSDSSINMTKAMGSSLRSFADALDSIKPSILLVVGDRYEIFIAALASLMQRVPIAHIHGGELSQGAIDDVLRHSLTKFSYLHFVANNVYRKRVIQLGEEPKRVFNVGGLGVDAIENIDLLNKKQIEKKIGIKFLNKNLLITYHPETLKIKNINHDIDELLNVLKDLNDTLLIFTLPNADFDNKIIKSKFIHFCKNNKNANYFNSLGQLIYLSSLQFVDGVVGNSSSGLLEAPSFKIGTINIGNRQKGRINAKSVISCKSNSKDIKRAIKKLYSKKFQHDLKKTINPYGKMGASKKIVKIIENNLDNLSLEKKFYNLKF